MKDTLETVFAWYWLVFSLPLLFSFILFLGSSLSGGDGDGDTGGGGDIDADADVDDMDLETPHFGAKFWEILGVGKVPLVYILAVMSLLFGVVGLLVQRITTPLLFPLNFGLALAAMFTLTPFIVRLVARWMPSTETYVSSALSQEGNTGRLTAETRSNFGRVQVVDGHGNTFQCKCHTSSGTLPKGTEVLLVELDPDSNSYLVEKMPL